MLHVPMVPLRLSMLRVAPALWTMVGTIAIASRIPITTLFVRLMAIVPTLIATAVFMALLMLRVSIVTMIAIICMRN